MSEKGRLLRPLSSAVLFLVAAGLLALPSAVSSRTADTAESETSVVSGRAKVLDGDTIEIAGTRIRLEGIDAPESAQMCSRKGTGLWPCGKDATEHLKRMTSGRHVACDDVGEDRYGRTLGWCTVDGLDINAEMVRSGFAWAFVRYSTRYVAAEREARSAEAGIWQGEAEPAWAFRERRRNARVRDRG
ncbi:thermonuclease family protein [Hyphomicrobium nitrativorans]|nr:thermonuclease family protein [Hyphomicrobium nitrativorans]